MAKILIIDDEEAFRNTISKALRKAGYAVCEVDNATDALTLARNGAFDLIISDIAMEGCDGITFLKQIRSTTETATVPFLFVSGHADLETMKIGAEEDADGILPKPFTLQTLLSTVSRRVKREELVRKRSDDIKLQLQSILEASPDFIGIIDPEDGRFTFINSSGRKMLGLGAYDDMGPIGFDAIHAPEEPVKASSIISLASNGTMWSGEALLQKRTGETFPVKLYVQGHSEADGHITYLSVIAHDLSESKRLEEDRKKMELQLTQAHKLESIGQLAAGIAHEINTPTQYIGDNTRFLQDAFGSLVSLLQTYQQIFDCAAAGSITPALLAALERKKERADLEFFLKEIPQAIQQSLDGLDRVTKIVRAMKDFSHPGVVEKTPIDINHAIESTVTVAKNEWKYVADLELNLDRSLPLVPCVPGEINQLILNLVVRACHELLG
jgi:PAS domain S-box-containing protein